MINGPIIHPPILGALAAAGHKSTILVADAHYAAATAVGPHATVAYLNFTAGTPLTTEVIAALTSMLPFERRTSMAVPDDVVAEVPAEVGAILGAEIPHRTVAREEFYALARSEDLVLCIVTGDTRRFANTLLTVGVNLTEPSRSG
tara:strand:- start:47164 stop:47601 length:438 start_codon:yes stop_codon:yes gene_type:complete